MLGLRGLAHPASLYRQMRVNRLRFRGLAPWLEIIRPGCSRCAVGCCVLPIEPFISQTATFVLPF